jgi:hypothetical protein
MGRRVHLAGGAATDADAGCGSPDAHHGGGH